MSRIHKLAHFLDGWGSQSETLYMNRFLKYLHNYVLDDINLLVYDVIINLGKQLFCGLIITILLHATKKIFCEIDPNFDGSPIHQCIFYNAIHPLSFIKFSLKKSWKKIDELQFDYILKGYFSCSTPSKYMAGSRHWHCENPEKGDISRFLSFIIIFEDFTLWHFARVLPF